MTGSLGITTACPVCGVLHLPAAALTLVVCTQDPARSFYQFTCPRCAQLVTRQASERTVLGMSRCGVVVTTLPAEALEERPGAALTADDLLDLALELRDDGGVAAFLARGA